MRAPFAARGQGDPRRARAAHRRLKYRGLIPDAPPAPAPPDPPRLPRVVVHPPRPGHVHPATRADVEDVLRRLGPTFHYGLRAVELVRGDDAGPLVLGRFAPVGRILLHDLPGPPWRVGLKPADAERLARAGARVSGGVVEWPDATALRALVLHHVLLHELGHHLLQHHAGKRPARVARTRAHEAHAELLAARARALLLGGPG
ncbi:MAG: hypothetical protein M9894_22125 [Planctomycetes bacterium]|nr:hypothetical protein [Planctomycetota bacterium]